MTWWIIALLLIAAFGPILWIMPSARDRLLTRLRAGARARGLLVELSTIPDPDAPASARVSAGAKIREPMQACTAYRHPLPRSLHHAPPWRLLATRSEARKPLPGWLFDGPGSGDAAYWKDTAELVGGFPDQVIAIECQRSHVSCYWRENVGNDDVEAQLDALGAALAALARRQVEVEQRELERFETPDPEDGQDS